MINPQALISCVRISQNQSVLKNGKLFMTKDVELLINLGVVFRYMNLLDMVIILSMLCLQYRESFKMSQI